MARYFVCKCATLGSLKQCVETGVWACKDRESPPHPRHMLTAALRDGRVLLIFSVVNCHGWHGVCEMVTVPGDTLGSRSDVTGNDFEKETESASSCISQNQDEDGEYEEGGGPDNKNIAWHKFKVQWKTVFIQEFGERCLSSKLTADFAFSDGKTVNKARNLQELPEAVGEKICQLIDQYYQQLIEQRKCKEAEQLSKRPPAFLTDIGEDSDVYSLWSHIVHKVERELGKVILACPFGSQRYNLDTADSDVDMFIVYQADTRSILGLEPPKHTVKNREGESFDYTVHEVHRYCELLTAGDPRCVETLFLHPSTVIYSSAEWSQLQAHKQLYLHSLCLEKYLRDGLGSNGVKQFEKWMKNIDAQDLLSPKLSKLVYIIVRLLQNARDVTQKQLNVYREEGSTDRNTLLKIRAREITAQEARELIQQLLDVIDANKADVAKPSEKMRRETEDWLLKLRYNNFIARPPLLET